MSESKINKVLASSVTICGSEMIYHIYSYFQNNRVNGILNILKNNITSFTIFSSSKSNLNFQIENTKKN